MTSAPLGLMHEALLQVTGVTLVTTGNAGNSRPTGSDACISSIPLLQMTGVTLVTTGNGGSGD